MDRDDILHVQFDSEDVERFGQRPIDLIKRSFALDEAHREQIRTFVVDLIDYLQSSIAHYEKWPHIYHHNTHRAARFEIATCRQILQNLDRS